MRIAQLASVFLLLGSSVFAHTAEDAKLEDQDLSLPDLEHSEILDAPGWKIEGNSRFKGGRLILTPSHHTKGSVTNELGIAYDSWTIEAIFRSTGSFGKTGSGLSLRYIKEHNSKDTSFFGGPSKFDGLNVIVDSDGPLGSSVNVFLNDGEVDMGKLQTEGLYKNSIGSCLVSYQDSQVPVTLRISYYDGILLVQVNNRICVKTKQVKLPKDYKLGLSAVTRGKLEQFELLKLKTYGGVLSEIFENDGKIAPQPGVVTKIVHLDNDGKPVKEEVKRPSSDTKVLADDKLSVSTYLDSLEKIQKTNIDLLSKFENMDSKLNKLSAITSNNKGGKSEIDFSFMEEYSKSVKALTDHILTVEDTLNKFDSRVTAMERNFQLEMNSLIATVNKLNNDNINQLRDNEHSIDELNAHMKFLVLSEELKQENPVHELIGGLRFLIIPILIVTAALSFFTYKLRREIKSKLL